MSAPPPIIRRRRPEDLPGLGRDLLEQQPRSRYPFRNPLPVSTDVFLHAEDALGAFVAEIDGDVVGHVGRTGPAHGFPDAARMNEACARVHGCAAEELSFVSSLFTAERGRGYGVGRALLEAIVADMREAGHRPCLEVLPHHDGARQLYLSTGWRDVLTIRPPWLTAVVGDEGPDVLVMVLPTE
jgi:GNAT superfamily N-acetyltransferase